MPAEPETPGPAMEVESSSPPSAAEREARDAESILDLKLHVAVLEAEIMQLREDQRRMQGQILRKDAQIQQKEEENWLLVRYIRIRENKTYRFLRKMAVRLQIDKTVVVPN